MEWIGTAAMVVVVILMAIGEILLFVRDKKAKLSLVVGVLTIVIVLVSFGYILFNYSVFQ